MSITFSSFVTLSFGAFVALAFCPESTRAGDGVIVTTSGRVVTGEVVIQPGGRLVLSPMGRFFVPDEQIRVVASDLHEAYRLQRDAVVSPTPASRMVLANWCIVYHLYDEARDELKLALKQNGNLDEARRLLDRIDTVLDPPKRPVAALPPRKTSDGFLIPDVESLGGLPRDVAAQFSGRIQPLLVNKCGNTGCHGQRDDNGFKLHAVRLEGGAQRLQSEQNLASVLSQIDVSSPLASRLLSVPRKPHGGMNQGCWSGAGGHAQEKMLRDWVTRISAHQRKFVATAQKSPSLEPVIEVASPPEEFVEEVEPSMPVVQAAAEFSALPIPHPSKRQRDPATDEPVSPPRTPGSERTQDAFDPDVFNRRIHGISVYGAAGRKGAR
ncbi:MAG: hypothetical protein KF777_08505 [Planctomycetaceae bacterium]|nr:hypothetical protein [Planctomycetaceae bacterium]